MGGEVPLVAVELVGDLLLLLLLGCVLAVLLLHTVQVQHLLHDEIGVVALVLPGFTMVDLQHPGRHLVQEVPVVTDDQYGAVGVQEVILQPFDRVDVQVGCGFIHHEQVAVIRLDDDPG